MDTKKKMKELMNSTEKQIMEKPTDLTDANFDEIVQGYPLMMIDFWSTDCQPCKVIAPIIEELARKYEGRLFVGKIRVDENPKTVERFDIRGVPTLLIIKDGREIDRIVLQMIDLIQLIKEYIDEKLKKHST
jgi:thioredoxin 1